MFYNIRPVVGKDCYQVIDIFNYYVENSYSTHTEERVKPSYFQQIRQVCGRFPFLVAELESREVAGFGFLHPHHTAAAFQNVAETTCFIAHPYMRKGIGSMLLNELLKRAQPMGLTSVLAAVSSLNPESIHFHIKNGFKECGRFEKICRKKDKIFDVVWLQRFF